MYNTTIVSAFLLNINKCSNKDTSICENKYIKNGKLLLQTKIPKIIFIDKDIYEEFKDYNNEITTIIKYDKNE